MTKSNKKLYFISILTNRKPKHFQRVFSITRFNIFLIFLNLYLFICFIYLFFAYFKSKDIKAIAAAISNLPKVGDKKRIVIITQGSLPVVFAIGKYIHLLCCGKTEENILTRFIFCVKRWWHQRSQRARNWEEQNHRHKRRRWCLCWR